MRVPPTLLRVSARYLSHHPIQSALMITGIALGVAVAVAVDIANTSASTAFDLSIDSVAGKATHSIIGSSSGISEAIYARLRQEGIAHPTAPVLEEQISSPHLGNLPLRLLGIDPFADSAFRPYLSLGSGSFIQELSRFMTVPGGITISDDLADQYNLRVGDDIDLVIAGVTRRAKLVGVIHPKDDLSRRALLGLVLSDISTAQELTGRTGVLDRIDLILPENDADAQGKIQSLLPSGLRIQESDARSESLKAMTQAFRLNLSALSMLALVVGMFLIYNTMTFSIVRRRQLFGTLRCLGVTNREIFGLILGEALAIGTLASVLGVALGVVLARGVLTAVIQTINDLYFALSVTEANTPLTSLFKGAMLGIVATVAAAVPPALEASRLPPRVILQRSGLEAAATSATGATAVGGLIVMVVGVGILAIPINNLVIAFAGTFLVMIGFALITPIALVVLMRLVTPLLGKVWGTIGRMASRNVSRSLSRTAVAVSALMVAVSVTIGIDVMVGSFRTTVISWLDQTLQGDIYIAVPSGSAAQPSTPIGPEVLRAIENEPGITRIDTVRSVMVESPLGPVHILATNNESLSEERIFQQLVISREDLVQALSTGSVLVSEPFVFRFGLSPNNSNLRLYTDRGPRDFKIVGVYFEYSSSQGSIVMSLDQYRKYWNDQSITAVGLRLDPNQNVDEVATVLQRKLSSIQELSIQPNKALRANVLEVFDRTFAVTGALQVLATIVAFVGILSALLALELDRQRSSGILRTIGVTARQVLELTMLETGLMGAAAGLVAMPTGLALSAILTFVINKRSFGWTLQMDIVPKPFIFAFIIAMSAALLAGLYPAFRMAQSSPAENLRSE